MTPDQLALSVEQFVLDRIGILAVEFEANESGARERLRDAMKAHDDVLAALDADEDPSIKQLLEVVRGTRLLLEDQKAQAVFSEMQKLLLDLTQFFDELLGRK